MVRTKTFASDIDKAVKRDPRDHFLISDTAEFLKKLLPVSESCVDTISKALTEKSLYKDGRWAKIPASNDAREDEFYESFIEIAGAISDQVATTGMGAQGRVNGDWVDRRSKSPHSPEEDAAKICPDCLYVSSSAAIQDAERMIAQARDKLNQPGVSTKDGKKAQTVIDKTEKRRLKEITKMSVWWRQVHTPVEIKRKDDPEALLEACTQLCRYMRQILAEQLDRRFVVGLVLCRDKLTVLLSDRSGILRTSTPIDIHQNPKQFIQVIASFSMLEAHQIGWDSTMEVYDPATGKTCRSYQVGNEARIFADDKYIVRWVIDIPSRDDKDKREKIITVKTLSAARSEVMVGRATLVWEAVKYEERMNPTEILVIKRYWRPYRNPSSQETLPSEGARYSLFGLSNDRLYSYEDIAVHDGEADSTLDWIRKKIGYVADETRPDNSQKTGSKRNREEDDDDAELLLHVSIANPLHPTHLVASSNPAALVSRVHTQLIMSHSGWPIRHFKNLLELLQVIRDGIRDHRTFYENGGVHRDVSSGNIIIKPTDDGSGTVGRLIDFDHAKVTEKFAPMKCRDVTDPSTVELHMAVVSRHQEMKLYMLHDDVMVKVLQVLDPDEISISKYIREVLNTRQRFFSFRSSGQLTSADLHWDIPDTRRPVFTDHEARSGHRTGTLPYMSAEVLDADFIFSQPGAVFFHDAIHDMESFFWVVVNICLTRKGPGVDMTRDELHPSRDEDDLDITLEKLLWDLFDSEENHLLKKKRELLKAPELMEDILYKFHPYFNQLKPMVLQWWHTMVLAYQFRAYEYLHIHKHIIDILEETITRVKLAEENPKDLEATQREIDRREMDRSAILKMFVPKDRLKTPPPTAAMSADVSPDRLGTTCPSWTNQTQRATKRLRN